MKTIYFLLVLCAGTAAATAQPQSSAQHNTSLSDTLKKTNPAYRAFSRVPVLKYDYYQRLGATCKVELKLEQATKVPFRFRLGSLQQTDYMEQKPNAQKPQP